MNKTETIKAIAEKTGKSQKDIKEVLEAAQEVTFAAVKAGDEVKLIDGLTIATVDKEAREYRNPATGETFMKPAHKAVKVKVGSALKKAVEA